MTLKLKHFIYISTFLYGTLCYEHNDKSLINGQGNHPLCSNIDFAHQ